MVRRLLKIVSWAIGGVLLCAVAAYVVLLLVNREDRPPSADIAAIESILQSGTPVVSQSNSYLYLLGFAAPPESDPMTLGIERHEWMERVRPEFEGEGDPLVDDYNYRSARGEAVTELAEACPDSANECLRLLESSQATVVQWLADEGWLLDRYRSLIAMTDYREARPFELLAPMSSYDVVFEGQRLLLAEAWLSAATNDPAAVNDALQSDLTYWRMLLENSDVLITKMIATAAIVRHFEFGNLVLRRLPQKSAAEGIPASWRAEISDEERSMKRSFAGEWAFFDEITKRTLADSEDEFGKWMGRTDSGAWDRAMWGLMKPLWQAQDLSNRHARLLLDLGEVFDVPYEEMPGTVGVADGLHESTYRPFNRLYNPVGDLVMGLNTWSLWDYAVRVSDLEGVRRAALLVAELRAIGVSRDDVAGYVLVSEIVDPYANEPLSWNADSSSVVFQGLEPHERSRREFIY